MSEITAHGEKKLVLAAGRAHPEPVSYTHLTLPTN